MEPTAQNQHPLSNHLHTPGLDLSEKSLTEPSLKKRIEEFFRGEVMDDDSHLEVFSKDAGIFKIKPRLVVHPFGVADIKKLVTFVAENPTEHLSITPRSAGTDMGGGAVNDSIIMEMTTHMHKLIKITEDSAVVQPGMFYRDFEKQTLKHDLLLPCYTASRELNTVGGMVANNSAGEKTLKYGQTKDFVKRLRVILSDGKEYTLKPLTKSELEKKIAQDDFEGDIYKRMFKLCDDNYDLIKAAKPKTHKNSSGYLLWEVWDKEKEIFDLSKIIVGSQGTLGIVTEAEFKLVHPKKHSNLLVVFLYDLNNLGKIVNDLLKFEPESFESFDEYTLKFALRFLPEMLKVMGVHNILNLGVQFLPEMWMTVTGGMPKLVLMTEFTGDTPEEVEQKCLSAQKEMDKYNLKTRITKSEQEAKKYWTIRRESFSLLRHHSGDKRTLPFIDDFIVPPDTLPQFLPKLDAILKPYQDIMVWTIAGHIGDGNFHIIPLGHIGDERVRKAIPEIAQRVYKLIIEYGGSITAEHNDGLVRGPYLEQMFGKKVWELFKQVKHIFDPNDIFNPHKKADATFEWSWSHMSYD